MNIKQCDSVRVTTMRCCVQGAPTVSLGVNADKLLCVVGLPVSLGVNVDKGSRGVVFVIVECRQREEGPHFTKNKNLKIKSTFVTFR